MREACLFLALIGLCGCPDADGNVAQPDACSAEQQAVLDSFN